MKRRGIRVEQDEELVRALARALGGRDGDAVALERIASGAVYVQGRRVTKPDQLVRAGQTLLVVEEAPRDAARVVTAAAELRILFEDDAVIAVDKPAGITAQPTPGRVGDSLLDVVSRHLGREAGLVHRLDRETSGVTIFGKTREATSALARQFRAGTAKKRYLAVATGPLPERGDITLPLSRDPSRIGRWRASRTANGLSASTHFERLGGTDGFTLVALFPATGRTHQLRAHLRALNAPIAGDALYEGAKMIDGIEAPRCLLHAQALTIGNPRRGRPLLLEAPVPADLLRFFERAKVTPPRGSW